MFQSVEQAMRFAFDMKTRVICKTTKFSNDPHATGDRMTAHDLHAQSMMILRGITDLTPLAGLYLYAKFETHPEVRGAAIKELAKAVARDHRLPPEYAVAMTRRYFSAKRRGEESVTRVASRFGVHRATVHRHEHAVAGYLNGLWLNIENELGPRYQSTGLIN